MSENIIPIQPSSERAPGYICPFCAADCSPISAGKCNHLFLVDGENGWRFTNASRRLHDAAAQLTPIFFRDLLYHNASCRAFLRLQRASYDDSLEIYVFSEQPEATITAFELSINSAAE